MKQLDDRQCMYILLGDVQDSGFYWHRYWVKNPGRFQGTDHHAIIRTMNVDEMEHTDGEYWEKI